MPQPTRYRINEIFYSLQGEGARAGEASVFVRLSGCNLQCRADVEGFDCDTEFVSGVHYTQEDLLAEIDRLASKARWIVWTGGEPALQLTPELLAAVKATGRKQAIETNGTRALPDGLDWICVSPKTAEHTIAVTAADEVKYVRAAGQGIPKTRVQATHQWLSPRFTPEGQVDQAALRTCIDLCLRHPEWKLSCQQHKGWGIR